MPKLSSGRMLSALAGVALTAAALALPSPARAWWSGGVWVAPGPPIYMAPRPYYYPPPPYAYYRPPPVWIPPHWVNGYYVPGHWR